MKKSLFALAALGAFASAAQAQSSVTLFGIIDASVTYLQMVVLQTVLLLLALTLELVTLQL